MIAVSGALVEPGFGFDEEKRFMKHVEMYIENFAFFSDSFFVRPISPTIVINCYSFFHNCHCHFFIIHSFFIIKTICYYRLSLVLLSRKTETIFINV